LNRTELSRETKETKIKLSLETESKNPGLFGSSDVGFFDHMLNTFAIHGGFNIKLSMTGDLYVDCHHTVEDVGIVLGTAFRNIIDAKIAANNIVRFGTEHAPMDESLAFSSVDLGGRAYLVFNADFKAERLGEYDTQMTREFFFALALNMRANIHINLLYGENDHHKTEAVFKSTARAIKQALIASDNMMSAK
jgi:imidazoleglycerol-phosphate dehydratase